jgi:hypothetical protein
MYRTQGSSADCWNPTSFNFLLLVRTTGVLHTLVSYNALLWDKHWPSIISATDYMEDNGYFDQ